MGKVDLAAYRQRKAMSVRGGAYRQPTELEEAQTDLSRAQGELAELKKELSALKVSSQPEVRRRRAWSAGVLYGLGAVVAGTGAVYLRMGLRAALELGLLGLAVLLAALAMARILD